MNRPHIILSVERVGNRFFPGEVLVSGYRIEISPEQSVTAVEASVIWRTTGKGEEDFGVHFFERRPKQTLDASVLKRPHRISTVLPRSPLSYDGELIKIHWSVRVSVFVNGQQYSEDLPFMLGNTSLAEYENWMHNRPTMKSNPFSTERISPAKCRFVFSNRFENQEAVRSLAAITNKMFSENGCAQIVGPHGSGKSTLANRVSELLAADFAEFKSLILRREYNPGRDGIGLPFLTVQQADLTQFHRTTLNGPSRPSLVIVDGIETLSAINRYLMLQNFARKNAAVLLTTHRRLTGVPVLTRLEPTVEHFRSIVDELLVGHEYRLPESQIEKAFHECRGDYRSAIWKLYDQYEVLVRSAEYLGAR